MYLRWKRITYHLSVLVKRRRNFLFGHAAASYHNYVSTFVTLKIITCYLSVLVMKRRNILLGRAAVPFGCSAAKEVFFFFIYHPLDTQGIEWGVKGSTFGGIFILIDWLFRSPDFFFNFFTDWFVRDALRANGQTPVTIMDRITARS